MNRIVRQLIYIPFMTLIGSSAYADSGWSGEATVTGIYSLNENVALIKLSKFSNPHNCSTNSSGDVLTNPSEHKTWFTVLLSAYMAGKPVNVYVTASCSTTHWDGPSFGMVGHVRLL